MNRSFLIAAVLVSFCPAAEAQEVTRIIRGVSPPEISNGANLNGDWELGGMSIAVPLSRARDLVVTPVAPLVNSAKEPEPFDHRDFREKQKAYGIKYPWQMLTPYGDNSVVAKRRVDLPSTELGAAEQKLERLIGAHTQKLHWLQMRNVPQRLIDRAEATMQQRIIEQQAEIEAIKESLKEQSPSSDFSDPRKKVIEKIEYHSYSNRLRF